MTLNTPISTTAPNHSLHLPTRISTSSVGNVPNAALVGATKAFTKVSPPLKPKKPLPDQVLGGYGTLSAGQSINSRHPSSSLPPGSASSSQNSLLAYVPEKKNGSEDGDVVLKQHPYRASTASYSNSTLSTPTPYKLSPAASYASLGSAVATQAVKTSRPSSNRSISTSPNRDIARIAARVKSRQAESAMRETDVGEESNGNAIWDKSRRKLVLTPVNDAAQLSEPRMTRRESSRPGNIKPPIGRKPSTVNERQVSILGPKPQRTTSFGTISPDSPRASAKPLFKPALDQPDNSSNGTGEDVTGRSLPPVSITNSHSVQNIIQQKPNLPPPRQTGRKSSLAPVVNGSMKPLLVRPKSPSPAALQRLARYSSESPKFQIRQDLASNPQRAAPAPYQERNLQDISPHITGDSLANAMVGANLAIRHTSPPKRSQTPPPVPTARRKHHHDLKNRMLHHSRSLSPTKRLPLASMTLRGDAPEDQTKLKKHKYRPKPNKHHEGTRERWRDAITPQELKRYEGVWAANKGIFVSSSALNNDSSLADEVQNLVVRDIWSRSRLPQNRLAMVWDLVASEPDTGRLTREQFVVGLWLIDQILRGRNLPHKVNASVWQSVRLRGVTVRIEGRGVDGRKLERGAEG